MDGTFQDMLADLRQTFNKRIPGGLTDVADERLHRTLQHYVKEVDRVHGPADIHTQTRNILRLSYDSMANWFRRNLPQISPDSESEPNLITEERFESEVDPETLFAQIKTARNATGTRVISASASTSAPSLSTSAPSLSPSTSPSPSSNHMLNLERALPPPISPSRVQQKDVIQPQEDVVKYREVEYNLIMNSNDRDWLLNKTQNRYNFNIQFNTSYKLQGSAPQAHIQTRLRNITRIEFIKAILPVEGLSVIVPRDCSDDMYNPQNAFYSVLALPSVNILADEVLGNNFGTNNSIDKSLAVCQYDATWRSETIYNKPGVNRGYALFFPKFMKAQRVYSPTPLSNLQTLSFRLQDPEDNLLSEIPDSSDLETISMGYDVSGSCYSDTDGNYIFLRTKDWFPLWSYSCLDKILLKGLIDISANGSLELNEWLQDSAGHSVIATAHTTGAGFVTDGPNSVGYANWIIIRNRFVDPTGGATGLDYFSNGVDDTLLSAALKDYSQAGSGILNLSRQVQLYIRVITREYDLTSNVRADNV